MTNKALYNWRNQYQNLPKEWLTNWLASKPESFQKEWGEFMRNNPNESDPESQLYHAAKHAVWDKAKEQAESFGLGLNGHCFTTIPLAIVEAQQGLAQEEVLALAEKYDLELDSRAYASPNSMWDIMAHRVEGDAIVALIGDDRGWEKDWQYFIVVGWHPADVVEEMDVSPTYSLI